MLDIDAWKIEFKKKEHKQRNRTYVKPLYLHCKYCGKNFKLKLSINSDGTKRISKKETKTEFLKNKIKLTVRCCNLKCRKTTVFEREGHELETYGWKLFVGKPRPKPEPRPLRPLLYEVDKTAAIIEAEKSRKRKHRRI